MKPEAGQEEQDSIEHGEYIACHLLRVGWARWSFTRESRAYGPIL